MEFYFIKLGHLVIDYFLYPTSNHAPSSHLYLLVLLWKILLDENTLELLFLFVGLQNSPVNVVPFCKDENRDWSLHISSLQSRPSLPMLEVVFKCIILRRQPTHN